MKIKEKIFLMLIPLLFGGMRAMAVDKVDGFYKIGTAEELLEFTDIVNNGEVDANAQLTADITVVFPDNTFIGMNGKDYQGTFDGQGHTLTVTINRSADGGGLFANIGSNGKVCNLIVDGTISGITGVGSFAWQNFGTLENCISLATVKTSANGFAACAGFTCASVGNAVYRNCIFAGSIEGENGNEIAGFNWVTNGGQPIYENCVCVPTSVNVAGYFAWSQQDGNGVYRNCFFTDVAGTNRYGRATLIDNSLLASGELCFKLNGDQSNIVWTQTLGEDEFPYPFTSHKQVYSTADLNCAGQPIGAAGYSNTPSSTDLPPHTYNNGFTCEVCGHIDENYCEQIDGFYQIGTPEQMDWFAAFINSGKTAASARLTADIDWSASSIVMGTGGNFNLQFMDNRTSEHDYLGTFDGQGHTLTVNIDHQSGGTGLFAHIGEKGKVCNIIIDGIISGTTGVGTFAWENWGTLENCVSLATIRTSAVGFAACGGMTCASHGSAVYKNCIFAGSIEGENANEIAGFNWYAGNAQPIYENCVCVPTSVNVAGYFAWSQQDGNGGYRNCFFTDVAGTDRGGQATLIENSLLASGELCFKLNGDQSNIVWTQTLGEDSIPYPFTSHKQVYSTAVLNCGGQPIGETLYTNTPNSTDIPPHTYNGGFMCEVCGHVIEDYMEEQDGHYYLSTADQLGWFAYMVNKGKNSMNAVLTKDIDFSSFNVMIGTNGHDYQGTFDGAGHKLTVNIDHQNDGTALFSHIGSKGKVCNLIVDGTICGTTGIGTFAWESWGIIENCVSFATIKSTLEDYGNTYAGGLACASRDNAIFRNCVFAGSFEAEGSHGFAGLVYFDNGGQHTLENCIFAPQNVNILDSDNHTFDQPTGRAIIKNCVTTYDLGNIYGDSRLVDAETLKSGEICYSMNNGEVVNPAWTQTLGEDELPYPFNTHHVIYMVNETTYMEVYDETSMKDLQNTLYDMETSRIEEIKIGTTVDEAYTEILETLYNADNLDDFNAAYKTWQAGRAKVEENAKAYSDYMAYAEEMKVFIDGNDIQGAASEKMTSYLMDYREPDEEFPNGSYEYIIDNTLLNTEELQIEMEFLNTLYNAVLKSDYGKDADITDLLTNANFGDRSNGWTGKTATNFDTDLYVAECNNNTFNMSQTLKNLKPGVYEVFINGFFRPAGENESRYYTAYLSANDQQVPIMHSVADAIPVEDAVDMENCYITNLSGEWPYDQLYAESYYIPGSMQGASYAFKGGRYVNHILVNVENDSLTIGVRSDGTGCANDWTVFANTRLYYRGTLDEATSAIDNVLADQAKRANEILEGRVDDIEYRKFPNFSQALRNELKAAIDATATTISANEKYELVKTFSALFAAVQDCQKAYVELYAACDMMADLYAEMSANGAISTDEYNAMLAEVIKGYEAFSLGTFTAEEAKAWKANLVPIEKDGDFYLINDAADMTIFALLVNGGQVAINGKLTADIDWSAYSIVMGTGGNFDLQFMDNRTSEHDYQGTFDGQGHTLTVNIDHQANGTGLFAHIGGNGKVCNLIVAGAISGTTGVGTFAWENWGTLENCVSLATIRTSAAGFAACGGMTCASHGSAVYKNCIFAGSIEGENANEIAGFNWYAGNAQPIYENCASVPTSVNVSGYFAWSQQDGNGVYRNCYFTDVAGTDRCGSAVLIENSLLASGELCFKLNGDQSNIIWTQTLGEDSIPYPFTSHKQVYSTASLNCAGQPIGVASYSNTPSSTDLPPHTYDNGFTCGVCGHIDENYCEQINGFYQIGTAEQMDWFAAFVNSGKTSANAQLTADIDWSASSIVMGTGGNFNLQFMDNRTSEHDYQGTFDGQGHTLTVNIDHQSGGTGLFAHIGENGKVCNIIIDGTISGTTGMGTFAWENWGTLENCVSLATIRTSVFGFAACGGMTCASHGSAVYKNCIFAGTIEGENANEIAGFNWYAGNAQPIYENCVCAPTSVNVSGYFAWSQQDGNGVYRNCYFTDVAGTDRCGGAVLIENSLLASGELCYKLNGDQSSIIWTQTLGEDEIPYPFTTHKTVVPNEDGSFGNITGIENLTTDNRHQETVIYDLSGRRISASSKLSKGIYVINGKKTVIK